MLLRLKARNHVDLLALPPRAAAQLDCQYPGLLVDSAAKILGSFWQEGGVLIVVGAVGAVTRLVAPLIGSKEEDPAVLVIDSNGENVIPLLGGHRGGAENLAFQLAAEFGGKAVLTGDSTNQALLSLDSFGEMWGWQRRGDEFAWKQLMLHQAIGGSFQVVQSSGSKLWRTSLAAENSLKESKRQHDLQTKIMRIGPSISEDCCWHPSTLWIGIGCERNTSKNLLLRAFENALEESCLAVEAVAGLASIELKNNEPALLALAKKIGRPLRFYNPETLAQVSVPNPSQAVFEAVGTPSVAEAAALLGAEKGGRLLKKKKIYFPLQGEEGAVTIAISESKSPFAPKTGELHLVGSGPGELAYLTNDARFALARAVVWIGYERYLDLLEPIRRTDQVRIDGHLTRERDRCLQALEMAMQGMRVALISSGDSGIYGMAGLALELWLEEPEMNRPAFSIHPGISAVQIAASKVGAPLMNDFCTISLSDKLTPWEVIKERLRGALIGDFAIAIYNPKSNNRDWQLEEAFHMIKNYRSLNTPVLLARQLGRNEERVNLYSLEDCPLHEVDMLTTILIGNTQSFVKGDHFVTPRGY